MFHNLQLQSVSQWNSDIMSNSEIKPKQESNLLCAHHQESWMWSKVGRSSSGPCACVWQSPGRTLACTGTAADTGRPSTPSAPLPLAATQRLSVFAAIHEAFRYKNDMIGLWTAKDT